MEREMCLCGTEEFASAVRYKKAQRKCCQYRSDHEGNEAGIDGKASESESQGREQ